MFRTIILIERMQVLNKLTCFRNLSSVNLMFNRQVFVLITKIVCWHMFLKCPRCVTTYLLHFGRILIRHIPKRIKLHRKMSAVHPLLSDVVHPLLSDAVLLSIYKTTPAQTLLEFINIWLKQELSQLFYKR